MYEKYWQLERSPFEDDTDPGFFFRSESHQAALLKLRYLIENRKGAGLLIGDGGVGKSYLAQTLQNQLTDEAGPFIHLVFPQMAPVELLSYLAVELGADRDFTRNSPGFDRVLHELERLLTGLTERGKSATVIVDEAHLIEDPQVFQTLRLLLNLKPTGRSALSLILAGPRELLAMIRRIGPLEERLAVRCLLRSLTEEETAAYITHRLHAAGAARPIFTPDALRSLYEHSGGNPRRINRLCDVALLVGFADDLQVITGEQIEAVGEELTATAAE